MTDKALGKIVMAGFIATFVMSIMMFPMFRAGVPKLDYLSMLWHGGVPERLSTAWWIGIIEHFLNGMFVFPLIYVYSGIHKFLPQPAIVKGLCWGGLLWLLSQCVAMPLLGSGFFSSQTSQPSLYLLASALGLLVYGLLFGAIAGRQR